jgi:hypothetical protein
MPDHYERYGEQWQRLHPGWSIKLWTDKDFESRWLDNQDLFDRAEEFVPPDAVGQFRSDVARYEILYRFGGVYADCDVEPLKPLDGLLDVEAFAGWEQDGLYVGNTIIGGVSGAEFWGQMVEAVRKSSRSNKGRAATWLSGPRVVTRVHGESTAPLTVYPQRYFFPYSYKDLTAAPELKFYPDAYAIHHWGHQREVRGRPLQTAGTSNPTLSVAVMAHKSRERWVPDLVKSIGGDVRVVWDRFNDRHDTGARALVAYDPDATHHMVVQDDALVAKDLVEGVKNALRAVPAPNPVGLYVGRAKPRADEIRTLMARATETNASFMVHKGPWWGVGIVVPTAAIRPLVETYDQMKNVPNYDRRVARYFEAKGLYCYYTVPSLVDHRIDDNPSLVPGRGSQGRHAHNFIGPRSALEVDWSGPIVRGKA